MKKRKNGKGKRNKGKLDSGADDSSKTEHDDLKRKKKRKKKSRVGKANGRDIKEMLNYVVLIFRKAFGLEPETRDTADYQERKEESYEGSGEISYLEAACTKCGNDFSEGYTTYIGNEKSYALISLVQLCPECWPEYEKLIREINLYGIDKDDGKCFECGGPAYFSFRIVREKLEIEEPFIEEPFIEEFFGDEMRIVITDDFCFIPFCGDCMQKFLLRMKSHFLKFTLEEIYYKVVGFCKSLK